MKPLVSQLWPQFMADPDFAACFGQVIVEHARMLRQDRQVEFTLRSAAPLDQNLCARLLASLQPDYEGFELKIKNLFGYAMLDEHALRILLEDMKRDGVNSGTMSHGFYREQIHMYIGTQTEIILSQHLYRNMTVLCYEEVKLWRD